LSREEQITDTIITQLRLLEEGLDLDAFAQKFGQSLLEIYDQTIEQLRAWEMITIADNRLRLTPKGWFLSNQVFYRFL